MEKQKQEKIKLTPEQAMAQALEHYSAGRYPAASRILAAIVAVRPYDADALNLSAATALASGGSKEAVVFMERAVDLAPKNLVFLANLAEMRRRAGDKQGGLEAARQAVAMGPNVAIAHCNLGIALYGLGDLDGAEAAQNAALGIDPRHSRALNNLGSIARDRKDRGAAVEFYRRALRLCPSDDDIATNLGTVLVEDDREVEALRVLLPYIRTRPNVPAEMYAVVGRAHLRGNALDDAEVAFRSAIRSDNRHVSAHLGLSQVLQQKNRPTMALAAAEDAARIDANSAAAHHQVGMCLAELGHPERALAAYERALAADPEFHGAFVSLGYHAMELGNSGEARRMFERAIAMQPEDFGGHLGLVRLGRVAADDPAMIALEAAATGLNKMHPKRAISLRYALAKGYEDQNRYDEAWTHYSAGAALKRAEIDYDAAQFEDRVDHIIEIMDAATIKRLRSFAISSEVPIFILGMPRSGTTLTETILASHPKVYGGGELHDLQRLLPMESGDPEARYPHVITRMDGNSLSQIAQKYVFDIAKLAPQSPYVTDKLPANFLYLGLIHAVMPNARIIHTMRDPIDTCVSCFTRLFDKAQLHSYDQIEMARYHNSYSRLMEHWRNVLPSGAFLDVQYETLVQDFDAQARRLVDWCKLPWDDACLEFHKTKRSVRTASVTQVREPIYTSSVLKWRAYEAYLGPMIDTLRSV
jgi:tetratricopeptide (TPR) repeat protein